MCPAFSHVSKNEESFGELIIFKCTLTYKDLSYKTIYTPVLVLYAEQIIYPICKAHIPTTRVARSWCHLSVQQMVHKFSSHKYKTTISWENLTNNRLYQIVFTTKTTRVLALHNRSQFPRNALKGHCIEIGVV